MRLLALALAALAASCSGAPGVGGACTHEDDCPSEATCFGVGDAGLRLCLLPCDPVATVRCDDETHGAEGVCLALDEGGACYGGGAAEEGDDCAASIDCGLGLLCVLTGDEGRCREACEPSAPTCSGGAACESLGGARGYCAP